MKTRIALVALASFFAVGLPSEALARGGGSAGNGGIAFVRRDARGKVVAARMLDLVEAEGYYFTSVLGPAGSTDGFLKVALDRVATATKSPALAAMLGEQIRSLPLKAISKPFALPDTKDYSPKILFPGYALETVGMYDDEENILRYDPTLFAALSPVDQAALRLHEALYKNERENESTHETRPSNSEKVRRVVGLLLAKESSETQIRKYLKTSMLLTLAKSFEMITERYQGYPTLDRDYLRNSIPVLEGQYPTPVIESIPLDVIHDVFTQATHPPATSRAVGRVYGMQKAIGDYLTTLNPSLVGTRRFRKYELCSLSGEEYLQCYFYRDPTLGAALQP